METKNRWNGPLTAGLYVLLALCLLIAFPSTTPWTLAQPPDPEYGGSGGVVDCDATLDTGDPVSAGNGAYHFTMPLLDLGGPMELAFSLIYRSDFEPVCVPQPLDLPRRFWWSPKITAILEPTDLTGWDTDVWAIQLGDGSIVSFKDVEGEWVLPEPGDFGYADNGSSIRYVLEETDEFLYLMDPIDEKVYMFEKLTSGSPPNQRDIGRIVRVVDRNGNELTYSYDAADEGNPIRIEDGMGRSLDFTYGASLSQVTDQAGRQVSFSFDNGADNGGVWTLRSVTDPLSHTTTFSYTTVEDPFRPGRIYFHNIIAVTHPRGNVPYTQTYEIALLDEVYAPRVVEQADAYGHATALTYDADKNEVHEEQPDGNTLVYQHHSYNSLPKSVTDAAGNTLHFDKNDNQQMTSVTDRLGGTSTMDYHAETGKVTAITNTLGHVLTYTYEACTQTFTNPLNAETVEFTFYQRAAIGYADGTDEAFSYDDRGNILTHEDQSGGLWTYTYTDTGQVLTSHNPLGGLITYTYNADSTLASSTDADTGVVTYDYDAYKRRTRLTHPDGFFVQTGYDLNDRITSITDENGQAYAYVYDANGNLVQVEDPAGNVMEHTFNLMDQVTQVTDRLGFDTSIAYDSLGRLASVDDGNGDQFAFGYDPRGWRNEIARGGETWQMTYTDEGQIASFTAPSGNSSTYPRNALGYETAVTDAVSRTAMLTRDERSRVTDVTDLLGRTTSFGYDGRGWLTEISVAGIGAVEYVRNGLGQVEQLVDQNGETWSFEYSGMGRLQTQTDPLSNTWQYEYDSRGRLHRTTFPDGRTMTRTHDAVGNTLRRHYSDGTDLHFQYDENNRLIATDGISLTRDAEGRVIETENSGAAFEATYGDAGRLLSVTYDQGTGQEAFTVTYTYNLTTGLLTKVSDDLTGAWVTLAYDRDRKLIAMQRSNGITTTLGRDDVGRITRIRHGAFSDLRYKLDAAGQVTQTEMTVPLDPKTLLHGGTEVQTYDATSQISSSGYSYDRRGRLTATPDHVFTWDDASRLIGVDDVTLTYNGLDDLFTRTEKGVTVHFYYNHAIRLQPIVAEREEGSGQFLRYYVWTPDGELLYVIDPLASDEVTFYHFDRTGSTLALTDEAGAVTDAYAYGPYGALLGHTGGSPQPFTFNGKWGVRQEGERGDLYQMRARVYDAKTSRFISRDPVWPALGNPFQVNPYQFAKANPVQWNDITGLVELIIPDGNGGGFGAISGIHYDVYIAGMSSEMAYVNSVEEDSNEEELVELWSTLGQFNDFTVVQDSALMMTIGDMSDAMTILGSTQVEDGVLIQDTIFGFNLHPGETVTDDQMQNLIENWQSIPDFWGNYWSPENSEDPFGDNEWDWKWW